jgi:formate-dependent phosphoribosylglycinamide formyltransferase (GAR transformylase)
MNPYESQLEPLLSLDARGPSLRVRTDSFIEFDAEMSLAVKRLVDTWSDYSTPNSLRRDAKRIASWRKHPR